MKHKKFWLYIAVFFIIAIGLIGYKTFTFNLFDDPITMVKEFEILKDSNLRIYLIPSNSTMNSSIQIRKVNNKTEKVLFNFDRFNKINSCKIINDSLILEMSDTNHLNLNKIVKLPIDSLNFLPF